ncbi:hypothetical protein K503DRAFT_428148 [Rhizopogon vinicolor AM-OR11-026]|uniref:Uncharacterized protein n=1 Tax=Rhizopogon vinicolor AM-OR11-026 TaxID=1314800 RepID=A0A1B7MPY6_9AGAM|nr:hypothetical protein K503DRAFT_428148 [Rhizopogon vinicolor AM-OR11-026]
MTESTNKFDPRKHVTTLAFMLKRVSHVSGTDFPGHHPDEEYSWYLERFAKLPPSRQVTRCHVTPEIFSRLQIFKLSRRRRCADCSPTTHFKLSRTYEMFVLPADSSRL